MLNDHCRICSFRDRCRDQAIREDNLSLLRGIGEKAIKRCARKGILTLTQFAHTFRPRRRGKRADTPLTGRDHALHALAIRDRTIYVLGAPTIPEARVRIYVDMEGDPEAGFIYLIGLVVCEGERVEHYSFWADDEKGEADIFARFLHIVAQYGAPRLYSYGNYERTVIARMRRHARRKKPVDAILAALTNVLTIIYPHFYFPTYSNGLKETAGCLGCRWTEPDASGIESVVWRKNWEKTGDASWKAKLIQCNLEDCEALRRICAFLAEAPDCDAKSQPDEALRVASVAQLDKLARTVVWSKFAHADFEFVNKRAYFDYQQRHVFVRTKVTRRKRGHKKERRRWQNRDLRVTHRMEITATRCPVCGSERIVPLPPKQRPKSLLLKRRYMQTHANAVDVFFSALAERFYESDASKGLQERLLRNRERLFTFLQHDGVSWNNNLAENAIKRVSDYREDVGRSVKEAGLAEHLVLLSLYQTCRVRDISFLKFLLSRERDMDAYAAGKHRRRRGPRIEICPKGYLPSSIGSLRRAGTSRTRTTIAVESE